jgi:hypothetical protein
MSQVTYNGIGKDIVIRADLSQLSGRDKSNLLAELMNEAGITIKAVDMCQSVEEVANLIGAGFRKLWNN